MERSDNCVTHWSLSQSLSSCRTGGDSLPAKEKGATRRQHCFPLQQQLWSCLVGRLEVYGACMSDGAGPEDELVSAGSSSALASVKRWTYSWHGCCDWYEVQEICVQSVHSTVRSAEQADTFLCGSSVSFLPVTHLKGRAVFSQVSSPCKCGKERSTQN